MDFKLINYLNKQSGGSDIETLGMGGLNISGKKLT